MKPNIFTSIKHWRFTASDESAEQKFKQLEEHTRAALPQNFYRRPLVRFDLIQASPLYKLLQTIPKGVMHHNHYFCNDDAEFYRSHILTDSRVYLTSDFQGIQIGTKTQAQAKGWVSMAKGVETWGQEEWLRKVVSLTCFTTSEMESLNYKSKHTWNIFESKIRTPLKILFVRDIFEKYSRHMLEKYIKNGYDRVEYRCTYDKLNEYDAQGNFVKQHQYQTFMLSLDGVIEQLTQIYPNFSFGMVFVGFKMWKEDYSEEMFEMACRTNWKRLVGFDYVQEEDKYESLASYDPIIDRVLKRYPHLAHLKKAYHAGETSNHLTDNIEIAVKAGTVRIGHGINILQRSQFLPHCKSVCFQKNPISNLLLGYVADLRDSSTPVLLGLGYPVSISPDDPGKFGYEDTTADYFVAALCYNWSLRHLKLIGYHSINHALCEESVKSHLIRSYDKAWDAWVHRFLQLEHITVIDNVYPYEDIFSFASNWSFSERQEQKSIQFTQLVNSVVANIPENIYQSSFFESKDTVKSSPVFGLLKTMPKGTLQSCHFITNHDSEFIRLFVVPHHDVYINDYNKQISIATPQEGQMHAWKSIERVKLELEGEQQVADYVYSLTAFNAKELTGCSGHQADFQRIYNKKKLNLQVLLTSEDIFRNYTRYTLKKLTDLGYLRVEFRLQPIKLIRYSQSGEKLHSYDYSRMVEIIDEEYSAISLVDRSFTIGFIILGNKSLSKEQNRSILQAFAQLRWTKCIGFDFEQDLEDSYPSLTHFTAIIDEVIQKYDDMFYHKVIQAGNSANHLNNNIETALQHGAKRICNGLNILQQTSLLSKCRQVCFEVNPIRNLAEGASKRTDLRLSIAPILLGLGFPVTVNSDLSGLLGFEDTTYDLFVAAVSFNWSLKHFKLMLLHSINHSCVAEGRQKLMLKVFAERWDKWVKTVME